MYGVIFFLESFGLAIGSASSEEVGALVHLIFFVVDLYIDCGVLLRLLAWPLDRPPLRKSDAELKTLSWVMGLCSGFITNILFSTERSLS